MTDAGEADGLTSRLAIQAIVARLCAQPRATLPDAWVSAVAEAGEGPSLAAAADRTMIAGLLWSVLTPHQREILGDEASERLRNLHLGNALRWAATRKLLIDAATTLGEAGIPVAPLKGAALQLTVYQDPGQRALTDLDLLVPEKDLAAAQELLSRDAETVHGPRASHHHLGGIVMPGAGGMIELHGADAHAALWPQRGNTFADGTPTTLEGASFVMPDQVDLWLHVACHGLNHAPHYWPRMAADLALLQGQREWSGEHWEAAWGAASQHGAPRAVLVAAAIANMARVPDGLRGLATGRADLGVSEERVAEAWSVATVRSGGKFGPWATDWVTAGEARGERFREYVLPPSARLSERLPVGRVVARVLYPCSVAFRCFELGKTGLAWRAALRRCSALPGAVLDQ